MSAHARRPPGIIRGATPADAAALSDLLACAGADNLPLSATDLAASLRRGHLLVLDLGAGTLGAAAHVELDRIRRERHVVFRYLAVHPALAGRGVEQRMATAMLEVCDGVDPRGVHMALATPDQPGALPGEAVRRMVHLLMFLLALPRVIASAGHNDAAAVVLVWSALALVSAARTPRIPRARAIMRRPRAARLRIWSDAVLLRFGELPLATCGCPAIPPPWSGCEAPVTPPAPPG